MLKLGHDRPDLLIKLIDNDELHKQATHFFHQLGKGMGSGIGKSIGDAVSVMPKAEKPAELIEKAIRGTGVVAGGLTDAAVTPPLAVIQAIKKLTGR